jgi:hypothetical protein
MPEIDDPLMPEEPQAERDNDSSRDRTHDRPSFFPPPDNEEKDRDKRRLFERVIPEIIKRVVERAVESGARNVVEAPENLKNFVQDLRLPKEALHYVYSQIDETKNGLYRVVAKEIRDVLQQTELAAELTKVLTRLSFEIKTEIRFIPNDQAVGKKGEEDETATGLPRPDVKAQVSVKDNKVKDTRRDKKREDS